MRWENYLGLSGWALNATTCILKRKRQVKLLLRVQEREELKEGREKQREAAKSWSQTRSPSRVGVEVAFAKAATTKEAEKMLVILGLLTSFLSFLYLIAPSIRFVLIQ